MTICDNCKLEHIDLEAYAMCNKQFPEKDGNFWLKEDGVKVFQLCPDCGESLYKVVVNWEGNNRHRRRIQYEHMGERT